MRLFRFTVAAILLAAWPVAAVAAAHAELDALVDEYWQYYIGENPLAATRLGLPGYDDHLPVVTPAAAQRRHQKEVTLLQRVRDVDLAALDDAARVNAQLLAWELEDSIAAYEYDLARIPFNTFSGFYMAAP